MQRYLIFSLTLSSLITHAMELRNGHTVGAPHMCADVITIGHRAVPIFAIQALRKPKVRNAAHFQCTIRVKELTSVLSEHKELIMAKNIIVYADTEGNAPYVFVTLDKSKIPFFVSDPRVLVANQLTLPQLQKAKQKAHAVCAKAFEELN